MKGLPFSSLLPDEEQYTEWMKTTVEPYLTLYRKDGFFSAADGNKIYFSSMIPPTPIGAVVVVHGFTESAEKYLEMSYWFMQMGYAIFALDQRGHGQSYRISDDFALTDVEHFSDYVSDLHCFLMTVVLPKAKDLPLYLYGHSMGGAVSVLYLQEHPEIFQKAVLTAPMLKPKTSGYPTVVSKLLSGLFRIIGKGRERVFAYPPGFDENEKFEKSPDTSRERFEYYRQKRLAYPYLQNTYPSYRWLNESLRIVRTMLNPKRCRAVKAKVLLFSAGDDTFVYRKEQQRFIALIPFGEITYEERARHEIYLSTNDVMADYLSQIESFLKTDSISQNNRQ